MARPSEPASSTQQIGRGGVYLTFTKLYFILFSYVIYWGLVKIGTVVGNESLFGDYKAINAVLSLISTVLVQGTMQTVSRFVGRDVTQARVIKRTALGLQLMIGFVFAVAFFFVAPLITKDESLVSGLRIASGIPLVYAVYSVFMGTLNGQRRFTEQALVDAIFTTVKVLFVLLGAWILMSAAGAFAGFLTAAVVVLAAGSIITNRKHGQLAVSSASGPPMLDMFMFQIQTVVFMAAVQVVVQLDIWYVQWFSSHPEESQSSVRSLYGTSQLFSQISYSLVVAVTFVLFPLVSASNLTSRPQEVRAYVREALRYALIMVVGVAAILTSTPEASGWLLQDLNTASVGVGIDQMESLRYLGLGYVCFSLFFVLCLVLTAGGLPLLSILLILLVAGIQIGLARMLVPEHDLIGQGVAGLAAMATGLIAVVLVLRNLIGPFLPWKSILRVLAAGGVVYGLALTWHPDGKLMTLARFTLEGLVFLGIICVLGEFTAADRQRFLKVLGKGGRAE